MFSTTRPGQTALRFRVNQGESPLVINTLYLGEVEVEVDVTVLSTGVKSSLVIDQLASEMSEADISAR